jgi:hypothetical protein
MVTEQERPKHVELQSSKNKNSTMNHMTIGCICWLKLQKLNYNAQYGKYKI